MGRRVVLLGEGISYSASPAMQAAAFAAAGLDWTYELLDVPRWGLAAALAGLRDPGCAGANVTIPHKVAVMAGLDGLEGDAEAAGAVNTIRREESRLIGSNTDVVALRALLAELGVKVPGAEAVVLGAGGSARAAAAALAGARLTIVARRPRSAAALPGRHVAWDDPAWPAAAARADLLLNATPLGRRGEVVLPASRLPAEGAVIDLVYRPGGTPLARAARDRGLRHADGWRVLLGQGAASFEAWTGRPAPLAAMRAALESASEAGSAGAAEAAGTGW